MRKVITVAVREYLAAVRTKAFIITLVIMPVFMCGGALVTLVFEDKEDTTDRGLAVVDYTGQLYGMLVAAAEHRNTQAIYGGRVDAPAMPKLAGLSEELQSLLVFNENDGELHFNGRMTPEQRDTLLAACGTQEDRARINELFDKSQKQVRSRFVLEQVDTSTGTEADIRARLKQRVESGQLFAFVELQPELLADTPEAGKSPDGPPPAVYYTARSTYHDMRNWLAVPLNDYVRNLRLKASGLDKETVNWVTQYVHPRIRNVRDLDASGQPISGAETNEAAEILVPGALMFLMFMAVMVGASPLVQSVLEEKMQRIAEVLVASVSPFELMLGKLVGVVGVSLTITGVYLIGGYMAAAHFGYTDYLPPAVLGWFIAYQALAILMFGSMFIAVGAGCSEMKEAQSSLMPVMLIVTIPMFVWFIIVREPTSSFSTGFSFIPTATPMLMVMRMSAAPEIPLWQPVVGVIGVLLTTLACVWAAGRIFRVGILMQGKGAKIGEMLRWVVRG